MIILSTLTLIVSAITNNQFSYAHGVLSDEPQPGIIRFSYDDGSPIPDGYISVLGADGSEIATGQSDDDGVFDYSQYENAHKITISDAYGHSASHLVTKTVQSEPVGTPEKPTNYGQTVIVITILLVVAAGFYYWNKKKAG